MPSPYLILFLALLCVALFAIALLSGGHRYPDAPEPGGDDGTTNHPDNKQHEEASKGE